VDERVGDPGDRPDERERDDPSRDPAARADEDPAEYRRDRRDDVQARVHRGGHALRVDERGEHDREDQAGDRDAQQRIEVQDPQQRAVAAGPEHQQERDREHEHVALDREVAGEAHQPHAEPDGGRRLARVDVGAALDDQHGLDDQRRQHDREQRRVPDPSRPQPLRALADLDLHGHACSSSIRLSPATLRVGARRAGEAGGSDRDGLAVEGGHCGLA
jgi:hypothetical protein